MLIDLSPRTDDRSRYCTNSGSVPSKFLYYRTFKSFKDFGRSNTQNLCTLQVFHSFSRKCKSQFLQSCPKHFIRFLCKCISKSNQRKLANHKKTSRGKVSRRSLVNIAKKNNLEAKKKRSIVRNGIATNSSHLHLPSIIICLDMEKYCSRPSFYV